MTGILSGTERSEVESKDASRAKLPCKLAHAKRSTPLHYVSFDFAQDVRPLQTEMFPILSQVERLVAPQQNFFDLIQDGAHLGHFAYIRSALDIVLQKIRRAAILLESIRQHTRLAQNLSRIRL